MSALRGHMYMHFDKPYECQVCLKIFHDKKQYDRHVVTHSVKKEETQNLDRTQYELDYNHNGNPPEFMKSCQLSPIRKSEEQGIIWWNYITFPD